MDKKLPFNGKTSADKVVTGLDLSGTVVVVTGANTGIGFETARSLASAGATVVLACRNTESSQEAQRQIIAAHPAASVECLQLDLASLKSVRRFCQQLSHVKIDTIICNAGVLMPTYEETEEGFEKTVGVCHIGHFLLVKELMPRLLVADTPRVVMVSSESHRSPSKMQFNLLPYTKDKYSAMKVYGQAKLCNALMARELDKRYSDQGLMACYLHPGTMVTTDIGRDSFLVSLAIKLAKPFTKTAAQGAATSVFCATWHDTAALAGQYLSNCQLARPSKEAVDGEVANRLWSTTENWLSNL